MCLNTILNFHNIWSRFTKAASYKVKKKSRKQTYKQKYNFQILILLPSANQNISNNETKYENSTIRSRIMCGGTQNKLYRNCITFFVGSPLKYNNNVFSVQIHILEFSRFTFPCILKKMQHCVQCFTKFAFSNICLLMLILQSL